MIAANFTEFRTQLKAYLDNVENNNETLIVKRGSGKGTVMISLEEDRKSVVQGKSVDLGGRRIIKKKNKHTQKKKRKKNKKRMTGL